MNANLTQRTTYSPSFYDDCQPKVMQTSINRRRDERLRLLNPGLRLNEVSKPCHHCGYDRTSPVACDWCGTVILTEQRA